MMRVEITARRLDISETLKQYIHKELNRLTKVFDRIIDVHVILEDAEAGQIRGELIVNVPGKTLTVEDKSRELTKTIDLVVEKMVRQLKKYKDKL
ncbi:MAG: ribosome-associated translation inhibitor RaiA [Candidatus Marinimicrobia bacterium]|nr:ribosome-associated translation inhibitor RaiA [Candidatus Neomarinimicrobiota bacterium]